MRLFACLNAMVIGACLAACDGAASESPPVVMTASDVVGEWVVEPGSYENAAYNMVVREARDQGLSPTESQIKKVTKEVAEILRKDPSAYVFKDDGTFTARNSRATETGTWVLAEDIVTMTSTDGTRVRRLTVTPGVLTNHASTTGGRVVRMIRNE